MTNTHIKLVIRGSTKGIKIRGTPMCYESHCNIFMTILKPTFLILYDGMALSNPQDRNNNVGFSTVDKVV